MRIFGVGLGLAVLLWSALAAGEETEVVIEEKPLSHWLKQLCSTNRGFQLRAAQVLAKTPADKVPQVIPKLVPLLKSERENDRFVAAQVLGDFGQASRSVAMELLPVLEGTQFERNRAAAAKALGQILKDSEPSPEVEKAVQGLIGNFSDRYSDARREAVYACGLIGPAAKACIPHLGRMLQESVGPYTESFLYWDAVAFTCGRMGRLAAEHVDRMLGVMLRTETTAVLDAIGDIGPVHANVVPNILDRMEQVNAGSVLIQKGSRTPPMSGEACKAFMEHGFAVLAKFGAQSASAVPFLKRFIQEGCERRKTYALGVLKALAAIGPQAAEAKDAVGSLAAKSPDADIRKAAAEAQAAIQGGAAGQEKNAPAK